ncbi:FAD-dependent oxidoreductase [Paraburkholderia susongensis]|uniref:Pyruvate/2-oxoglutarate dehydrogenase complex, dihydrolipoamide dehydrogenase (E3) component n=1 Tax=Paraburkholderia susongensis TaxID=1515439 RepID=A0A1X7LR31_9BURK|nr:FAD-dependent oxidoreductase [Paraburkholderia susongensis]SMG55589.1 Pyruvate/2-oxoglutarate dehydrogenase complex, dihydrolipoamide dehydrogenase (E3) component [Paraburkholderia susongensis]
MHITFDVLVVGAGPAGVSAAIEMAAGGAMVLLVEQRSTIGGAIHRSRYDGTLSPVFMPARHKRNWTRLKERMNALSSQIRLMTEAVFLGIDGDGYCVIDHRRAQEVKLVRPKAVLFAVGASEQLFHAEGWNLPGVVTAGGLQVQIKETGIAPVGRILVAGSGPLPLALSAQLAKLGNAPVAILEPADPIRKLICHPSASLGLLAGSAQLAEGFRYAATLLSARTRYKVGATVEEISKDRDGLRVVANESGQAKVYEADLVILHDGLASNSSGLPKSDIGALIVERAGDCSEVLGADAAIVDGRRVGKLILDRLFSTPEKRISLQLLKAKVFQRSMSLLFERPTQPIQGDAVVCRCEGVRRRDIQPASLCSARELKLINRVGMGACQGRFCEKAAAAIALEEAHLVARNEMDESGSRWPIRPVSVAALAKASQI